MSSQRRHFGSVIVRIILLFVIALAILSFARYFWIDAKMIEPAEIDRGIKDLYRTTESDGVFCYTFFKAVAEKR